MKKGNIFGVWALIFLAGTGVGILTARFSGGILTGQPVSPPKQTDGPEYSHRQPVSPDLASLFPKIIIRQGDSRRPALTLTFDDGPDLKYTPRILDVLKKYNVKATFFVVGTQIEKYPATFRRIIREGHAVGNHGYQHLKITELAAAKQRDQLTKNQDLIRKYGGLNQLIFRPPYGAIDPATTQNLGKLGYQVILWTIDSLDWRGLKKPQITANVVPKLNKGYIILQHSAADSPKEDLTGSVEALPEIIAAAQRRGYRFITIPQLLKEIRKEFTSY